MINFMNTTKTTAVITRGEMISTAFRFSSIARMNARMNSAVDRMKPIRGVRMI